MKGRVLGNTDLPPLAANLRAGLAALSGQLRKLGSRKSRARATGSYRLGERLGAGGMGEVFRAEHQLLGRPAAVKVVRADVFGGSAEQWRVARERLRREAGAVAQLQSPHTIQLYDFGATDDGGFYYAMELLDGLSFEDLVERFGPVPAERAVHLVMQACESLAEAHARGLIHRDLKPANLFASRVGLNVDFVKVLDFGLVKRGGDGATQDIKLTAPDMAAGTPAFMAPEVALGEKPLDARADVYALGCLLYWLLTGQWVFNASSPLKLMHAHVQQEPVAPSRRTELPVPPELDALVLACLAKQPEHRPVDAGALLVRLAALGLDGRWTREHAERWWEAHVPAADAPADSGEPTGDERCVACA